MTSALAMLQGLVGRSQVAVKRFSMSDWDPEDSSWNGDFGAWAASQLVEKTECDVTEHVEVALSHMSGKWRRISLRRELIGGSTGGARSVSSLRIGCVQRRRK
jgi:hypothetical protein